ncbi:tail assembly chaperone [Staphylococcus phage PG-2021_27]
MSEQTINEQEFKENEIQEKQEQLEKKKENTVNKVIKGVNDTWEKEFNFPKSDLHFKLRLRVPNVLEQGRIGALTSQYLAGNDENVSPAVYNAYYMLATMQVVGIQIPKEFRNPEDVYVIEPLFEIYIEWVDFLDSFQF